MMRTTKLLSLSFPNSAKLIVILFKRTIILTYFVYKKYIVKLVDIFTPNEEIFCLQIRADYVTYSLGQTANFLCLDEDNIPIRNVFTYSTFWCLCFVVL